MFSLFNKKYDNPELLEKISQTQDRWFDFLNKLEIRMDEMCRIAIPEILEVFNQDNDPYKRKHGHMVMGLCGQIRQIQDKAYKVKEEEIFHFIDLVKDELPDFSSFSGHEYHNRLLKFRLDCINRHHIFEEKIAHCNTLLTQVVGEQDLETAYKEELMAFENIRDKFTCKQCSGNLSIPEIFFFATYITCPFCQTQNSFIPSSGAQIVLHQARSLAEQRMAHLRRAYDESIPKNSLLYKQYLRSMFDEWNRIVPVMTAENEKNYQRMLQDHLNPTNHY